MNTVNLALHHNTVKSNNSVASIVDAVYAAKKAGEPVPAWALRLTKAYIKKQQAVTLPVAEAKTDNSEAAAAMRVAGAARHAGQTSMANTVSKLEVAASNYSTHAVAVDKGQAPLHRLIGALSERSQAVAVFAPILRGESNGQWAQALAASTPISKAGKPYDAVWAATAQANRCMSEVNRHLYGAYLLDAITFEQFEGAVGWVNDAVTMAVSAVSAPTGRDAASHGAAIMELRVKTQDHGAAERTVSRRQQVREEIQELQQLLVPYVQRKEAIPADLLRVAQELATELKALDLDAFKYEGEDEHAGARKTQRPNDTGWISGAVDSFDHLYALPVKDIAGLEATAARALWHLEGLSIPTIHKELMEERLVAVKEAAKEYDPDTTKHDKRLAFFLEEMDAKVDVVLKDGTTFKTDLAGNAKFIINALTRRLWRDEKRMAASLAVYTAKLDSIIDAIKEEERDVDRVPTLTRHNTGETMEMGYTLSFPFIGEYGDEQLDPYASQGERLVALYTMIVNDLADALPKVREMYKAYRALDERFAPLWALFSNDVITATAPPVYWNMDGAYVTEQEAVMALAKELKEAQDNRRRDSAAKADELLEEGLQSLGRFEWF